MLSRLCAPEPPDRCDRATLIVGHPGHELRVFGWMSECRPRVHVLTDGSGRRGVSRIPSTARLITRRGAARGEVFGSISDEQIYQAILSKDFALFRSVSDRIAASFVKDGTSFVAGDATEGYNPAHDLCRLVINAAVMIAARTTGKSIANYEFRLTEWEQGCQEHHDSQCLHFRLDDALLREKLEAADDYAELKEEVRRGVAERGQEYFRIECLRKVTEASLLRPPSGKPFYERWGEQRVAEGEYRSVIRYRDHMLPVIEAVLAHAAQANVEATVLPLLI
jgi:hypothetical protein